MIVEDVKRGLGIHLSENGQPFALVEAGAGTSLTCSHEALEMLADPFGMRLVASQSIKPGQGRVNYLAEVCGPCEAEACAYTVNGVTVSDFYTPRFFDPVASAGVRYSYSGRITAPRQVLHGGYVSWMVPRTGEWWQAVDRGAGLEFRSLGVLRRGARSWREVVDAQSPFPPAERGNAPDTDARLVAGEAGTFPVTEQSAAESAAAWAGMLELDIARVTGMAQ